MSQPVTRPLCEAVHFGWPKRGIRSAERHCLSFRLSAFLHLLRPLFCLSTGLLACSAALAVDYSLTGFGTIGYAVSDMAAPYLRYIDKRGTFRADSLIGLQGEAQFNSQWSATAQIVGSAPRTRDDGAEAKVRWAFVSYRPTNEWLFRVGRLRPPVLINTQNAEVGVTYDPARLPVEVYSLSPVYDLDGGAFTRTWVNEVSETTVDGYLGRSKIRFRAPFQRDRTQTVFPDKYFPESVDFVGLVTSYAQGPWSLRGGVHRAVLKPDEQREFVDSFNPIPFPAPPPFGGLLYTPGKTIKKIGVTVVTLGADWRSGDWRVSGEYGQRIIKDTKMGVGGKSAYLTIARSFDRWTSFASYARLLSAPETRKYYREVNATPVPPGAQGPPLFIPATYHQVLADGIFVTDQYSMSVGTAYSISPSSKLKFELMQTHIGLSSSMVDGNVHHKSFRVLSMSYSFLF